MGYYYSRFILAPSIQVSAVDLLAADMRRNLTRASTLYLCDLEGKRVRKPHLVAVKDSGARVLEVESQGSKFLEAARQHLDERAFVFCEGDDEDIDSVFPDRNRLRELFGTESLDFLLNVLEEDIPWNRRAYYCVPGNPDDWPLTVPLQKLLLHIPDTDGNRECPCCRRVFQSRFLLGQCRDESCRFRYLAFNTISDALTVDTINVDTAAWGRCTRCGKPRSFAHLLEQCFFCGRLLEVGITPKTPPLHDNRAEMRDLLMWVATSYTPPRGFGTPGEYNAGLPRDRFER